MNSSFKRLVRDTLDKCIEHKFAFYLSPNGLNLDNANDATEGYVDDEDMIFAVSSEIDGWEDTFVHESAHLDQYIEKSPLWFNKILKKYNPWEINKHPNDVITKEVFKRTLELEIDCDNRAIKKIKEYGLEKLIPISEYIRIANVYHASHYYFYQKKCFFHKNRLPHEEQEILDRFPKNKLLKFEESWKPRAHLSSFLNEHHVKLT